MFKISLKDVGENRVTKDIISNVRTKACAVSVAYVECGRILNRADMRIEAGFDNEYNLLVGNTFLGSFTIVKQ